MDELVGAYIVRFGGFRFDRSRGLLARQNDDGTLAPVTIGSRALGLLIDRHGDLVSKDEILNTVWPRVVEGANVTVQISTLRRALDEVRSSGSLIQTIPGRGYRLATAITRCEAEPLPTAVPQATVAPRPSIVGAEPRSLGKSAARPAKRIPPASLQARAASPTRPASAGGRSLPQVAN